MRRLAWVLMAIGCGSPAPKPVIASAPPPPAPVVVVDAPPPPVAVADAAPPAAPPEPPFDVAGELAWARKRWPKQLGNVETGAAVSALRDWVAPGATLAVWVTSPQWTCKRGELSRAADDAEDLSLTVFTKETANLREFDTGTAGAELFLGGSGGSSVRDPQGNWTSAGMWAVSEGGSWGHLSKVTADFAQFGGVWVDIAASCAGAETKLACTHGETITCSACTDTAIAVTHREMGMVRHGKVRALRPIGCPDCATKSNPDLDRVSALLSHLDAWALELPHASTIYRTQAACAKRLH